jgi:hypothetical protein
LLGLFVLDRGVKAQQRLVPGTSFVKR